MRGHILKVGGVTPQAGIAAAKIPARKPLQGMSHYDARLHRLAALAQQRACTCLTDSQGIIKLVEQHGRRSHGVVANALAGVSHYQALAGRAQCFEEEVTVIQTAISITRLGSTGAMREQIKLRRA